MAVQYTNFSFRYGIVKKSKAKKSKKSKKSKMGY